MPTPIRIVVYFDDGTSRDINVRGMSSVFFAEDAAVQCGHRPPYKKEPPPSNGNTMDGAVTLMATADNGGTNGGDNGDTCYWIDGVIVCP